MQGQTHCSGATKEMQQIVAVPRGATASGLEAPLVLSVLAQQVERQAAQRAHITRRMLLTDTAGILLKSDIQHPMHLIFNTPVTTHRLQQTGRVTG